MSIASWIRQKIGQTLPAESRNEQLLAELEFVLLDVDLTGTDATQDSVIGLAYLPLVEGTFQPAELGYIHFADATTSAEGRCAPEIVAGYQACLDLMARSVVVTINPNFIQHMLALTAVRFQLPPLVGTWLDLSAAAGVIGGDGVAATSLGHWLEKMKTGGRHEHDATYDVFVMAQLLQALLAYAEDSGIETLADLRRNQSAESWMRPY